MTGVEILNEYVVNATQEWVFVVCGLGIIGVIICAMIVKNSISEIVECICLTIAIILGITSVALVITNTYTDCFKEYSHTEYKVTIDDSVSMNEFLDKYEILDQEGKIYTVKEKE